MIQNFISLLKFNIIKGLLKRKKKSLICEWKSLHYMCTPLAIYFLAQSLHNTFPIVYIIYNFPIKQNTESYG